MKKIITTVVAAVIFASSTFAIDLGIGGKVILGKNVAEGETIGGTIKSVNKADDFDFGGSAYVNLGLFGGLGAQLEANYINSKINFTNAENKKETRDVKLLDIAPMAWLNLDLWKLRIGVGAGPNFSIALDSLSGIKTAKKDQFTPGLCAGADVRFYITDHFGLVVSGRYVGEFTKKEQAIEVAGADVASYPKYEKQRQTLYGGIGAEFKLF